MVHWKNEKLPELKQNKKRCVHEIRPLNIIIIYSKTSISLHAHATNKEVNIRKTKLSLFLYVWKLKYS